MPKVEVKGLEGQLLGEAVIGRFPRVLEKVSPGWYVTTGLLDPPTRRIEVGEAVDRFIRLHYEGRELAVRNELARVRLHHQINPFSKGPK